MKDKSRPVCPNCKIKLTRLIRDEIRDFEYGAPGIYSWIGCERCGLIRLDPFPSSEVLELAYPNNYHTYVKSTSTVTNSLRKMNNRRLAKKIGKYLKPGMSILDIGCSRGDLLEEVGQRGSYHLYGIENKADAAQEARSKGIQVWESWFEEADVPPQSIDVVLMWHVLEHMFDPIEVMKKVLRVLKPGGMVLGELPNFKSWDAKIFGRYWGGGHAPRHLWHFQPGSLKEVLATSGFKNISIQPAFYPGHFALSFQHWFRRHKKDCKDLSSGRSWYFPFFSMALTPVALLQMPGINSGAMRFQGRSPQ